MRRLILLTFALLWLASPAQADATIKQRVIGSCNTNAATCTITVSSAITAGDALVIVAGGAVTNNSLSTVTATGHTFTVLDAGFSGASNPWIGDAYECNAASGTPTITVTSTNSAGGGSYWAILYEVQGAATSTCIDGHTGQFQSAPGTAANAITSGSITVGTSGEFFIGGTMAGSTTTTISLGTTVAWANLQTQGTGYAEMNTEEFPQAVAAGLAATFTQSVGNAAVTLIVGVKPSGGGGGVQSPGLLLLGVGGHRR